MVIDYYDPEKEILMERPAPAGPDREVVEKIKELAARGCTKLQGRTGLKDLDYVVIDLETTGLSPNGDDEIISIGAVLIRQGRVCPEPVFHRLVNPHRSIPEQVVSMTGITDKMVRTAGDIFNVLPDFLKFINSYVLIGHWVHFDLCFLNNKLKQCQSRVNNAVLDTCFIARALLPGWHNHSLDYLISHYGLGSEGRHTALGDALITARLFLKFLDTMADRGVTNWSELGYFLKLGMSGPERHCNL